MTAYLQHGDSVHLAIPMFMKHGSPDLTQAQIDGREITGLYASHGVTVVRCEANTGLTAAVVTAVFRNPKGPDA